MPADAIFQRYRELLISLRAIVIISQNRVIREDPDELFQNNVNFFVKSYLISTCTYLEAYLQDVAFDVAREICARVDAAQIPHNFIHWKSAKEVKEKELKFAIADLSSTREQISDAISANPYRTLRLFKLLGINLLGEVGFVKNKDFINAVVSKRNNIIHHNDSANDISFSDIIKYIDVFVEYMGAIQKVTFENGA